MQWNPSIRKSLALSSSVSPCKGTRFISSSSSTVLTRLLCRPRVATDVIINPRGCWAAQDTLGWKQPRALQKKKKITTTGRTWSHSWDGAGGHIPSRPVSKASKHKGGDGAAPTKGPTAASSFHAGQYKSTRFPVKTRCTSSPRPLLCFIGTITPWQRPHFFVTSSQFHSKPRANNNKTRRRRVDPRTRRNLWLLKDSNLKKKKKLWVMVCDGIDSSLFPKNCTVVPTRWQQNLVMMPSCLCNTILHGICLKWLSLTSHHIQQLLKMLGTQLATG